ncbi:MAG: hypothetical protein HOA04_07280 [Euryarchaeota archaeon]|nr:hypothetical protein [Euryarchaeota archaeon]
MSSNSVLPLGALDLHDEHILLPPSAKVSDAAKALLENPEHSILIYEGIAKKGVFSFLGGKKEKVLGILSLETLMHSLDDKNRISGKHSITKAMKDVLLEYHVGTPLKLVVDEITQRQPYGVIARASDGTFVGFMSMGDFQEAKALVNGRVPPSETRTILHGPSAVLSDLLKPDPSTGMLGSKPMVLHPHETFGKLIDSLVVNIKGQAIVSNLSKKDAAEGVNSLYINQLSGTANVQTVLKILASGHAPKAMKLSDKYLDETWLNMSEESLFSRVKEASAKGNWNSLLVTDSRDRVLAAFSKAEFARHDSGDGNSASLASSSTARKNKAKAPFIQDSNSNTHEIDNILKTIEKRNGTNPPEVEEHGEDDTHEVPELSEQDIEEHVLADEDVNLTAPVLTVSIPIPIDDPEEEIDDINDADAEPEMFNMDDPSYDSTEVIAPNTVNDISEQTGNIPPPPLSTNTEMESTIPRPPTEMVNRQPSPPPPPPPMDSSPAPPPLIERPPPPSLPPTSPPDGVDNSVMEEKRKPTRGRYV